MTKTEIIDSLLEQARDKMTFVAPEELDDEENVFVQDTLALTKAAQMLMGMEHHGEWENMRTTKHATVCPLASEPYTSGYPLVSAGCSECGEVSIWNVTGARLQYCPHCGAKMDGGDQDD